MKVLFAVSNENISESIVKKYQKDYKEIISYKNVYYFNAILKEIQKDKSYDRIVISEDLEPFANNNYEQIDRFIFDKLDGISDEAENDVGEDIPIILICSDRRSKSESILVKLFGIGIYSAILGQDRSIDTVCKLINRPRSKKDAKQYYKIDSDDVNYQTENENEVSEEELQNILNHYKKLGKNEERYVDSFNNIASQYNDIQLKLIVSHLPIRVKAVLESESPKYQELVTFNPKLKNKHNKTTENKPKREITANLIGIETKAQKTTKPVVIPTAINTAKAQKLTKNTGNKVTGIKNNNLKEETVVVKNNDINKKESAVIKNKTIDEKEKTSIKEEPVKKGRGRPRKIVQEQNKKEEQPVKKGRGRPRKIVQEQEVEQPVKRGRGRPKKIRIEDEELDLLDISEEDILTDFESVKKDKNTSIKYNDEEDNDIIPGFDDEDDDDIISEFDDEDDEDDDDIISGFDDEDDEDDDDIIPGFDDEDDEDDDDIISGFDDEDDEDDDDIISGFDDEDDEDDDGIIPGFDDEDDEDDDDIIPGFDDEDDENDNDSRYNRSGTQIVNNMYVDTKSTVDTLLTKDKKMVAFVGTTKAGTSFIINNLAEITSSMGIKTAILDTTENRNSYYIYTKNEDALRTTAFGCFKKLRSGIPDGIKVNKNLTIFTSLPDPENKRELNDYDNILSTLVQNYSLVLIDCDFNTPIEYFAKAQEIYLVQSMDVLTIQPLTAFLRDLKAKNVLKPTKLRVIINKEARVRSITVKTIIGGMSYFNDPAMSFMTELFDRNTIKYINIPFDISVYERYLEGLVNCNISINGYPKMFIAKLKELASIVYPMVSGTRKGIYTKCWIFKRKCK